MSGSTCPAAVSPQPLRSRAILRYISQAARVTATVRSHRCLICTPSSRYKFSLLLQTGTAEAILFYRQHSPTSTLCNHINIILIIIFTPTTPITNNKIIIIIPRDPTTATTGLTTPDTRMGWSKGGKVRLPDARPHSKQ